MLPWALGWVEGRLLEPGLLVLKLQVATWVKSRKAENERGRREGDVLLQNWHLINLTCSQVERKQGKWARAHTRTHARSQTREERGNWTGKWSGMYRKETRGEVLPEDIVVGLPSTTNPCPVNFMLSSPQAKRPFASMEGCEGTVSVGNRWCAADNQTLLLYFDMIYYFIPSENQTARAGRLQSCCWITHRIKPLQSGVSTFVFVWWRFWRSFKGRFPYVFFPLQNVILCFK